MQSSGTRDFIVGLFVVAGLLTIGYLSTSLGGLQLPGAAGFRVIAVFDDIGKLSKRSPVKIAGVRVGQVGEITLDEDLRARVALDLDAGIEISIDSSAAIRTEGLLGANFISLEPGAEDELMAPGEFFTYTESAISIDSLLGLLVQGDALGDE